jgi:hypothetical protein
MTDTDVDASMLLLAVYGVECGLKSLVLNYGRKESTATLEPEFLTHDLNFLSNQIYRKKFFPEQIAIKPKGNVAIVRLHEALRYGVRLQEEAHKKVIRAVQIAVRQLEESFAS